MHGFCKGHHSSAVTIQNHNFWIVIIYVKTNDKDRHTRNSSKQIFGLLGCPPSLRNKIGSSSFVCLSPNPRSEDVSSDLLIIRLLRKKQGDSLVISIIRTIHIFDPT